MIRPALTNIHRSMKPSLVALACINPNDRSVHLAGHADDTPICSTERPCELNLMLTVTGRHAIKKRITRLAEVLSRKKFARIRKTSTSESILTP